MFSAVAARAQGVSWSGDLRLRAQNEADGSNAQRTSQRYRLRLDVKADIQSDLKAEIRLATSRSNNSMNQTMGDSSDPGMARRFDGLDLAFMEWSPVPALKIDLGRFPQLHERPGGSQILLDDDLALEGLAFATTLPLGDSVKGWANAGSTIVRENYDSYYTEDLTDCMINWAQAGATFETSALTLKTGFGFMNYTSLKGSKFSDVMAGGSARGNSENPVGIYSEDYVPREAFVDVKVPVGSYDVRGFAELITNGETAQPHEASWIGAGVSTKSWSVQVAHAEMNSDAVPAIFTDSDYAGQETDNRGWIFKSQWKFAKGLTASWTQVWAEKGFRTIQRDFQRTNLDLTASF